MVRFNETDAAATLARYKRLILLGKASLPLEVARRIVGPDCAYHLYFRNAGDKPTIDESAPKRTLRRRRK